MLNSVTDWLEDVSGNDFIWYVKRLSGNDTLANGSHQAGPYLPNSVFFEIFPSTDGMTQENQKRELECYTDSHGDYAKICGTWYNNKFREGTRNETRLTGFGGQDSAILDPESTGALTVFAFRKDNRNDAYECHVWVSRHETEEDVIEDRIGPVEPSEWRLWRPEFSTGTGPERTNPCWLANEDIPNGWLETFPSGADIIKKTLELRPIGETDPDTRLIKRRQCEYDIFRSLEEAVELPVILKGFNSLDDFVGKAQSILQRRKSRSGRSLELHAKEIFLEENFEADVDFSHQPVTEQNKKPDFLFPSFKHYHDSSFPEENLRMLAVKTSCKDRWRQILNEADRIKTKHLLTLQEGISENQFEEMKKQNVQLVVPEPIISKYPGSVQPHIQTFESFIGDIRLLKI